MANYKIPPTDGRSMLINHEGMRHAPENELGVVFLFSKMARRLGFVEIDRIQPHFPDCWAVRKDGARTRSVWIEFEHRSRSFQTHVINSQLRGISPKRGVVVCWDHDWPECEKYAEVIPLRRELDAGRQVWIQNTRPEFQENLNWAPKRESNDWWWTVAPSARPGDLLLMYRAGTNTEAKKYGADPSVLQSITNVLMVRSTPRRHPRWGWRSNVTRVANLVEPLRYHQLKSDRVLQKAHFIRRQMLGRSNATAYWYRIHDLILKQNHSLKRALRPFAPETF